MVNRSDEDDTRQRIKIAAIQLFSRHGIEGVSVRAILNQASVKNSAGIHYYFRTKDDLIRELVRDALMRTRRARNAALDALEASGAPIGVRDIVELIVKVETVGTGDPEQRSDLPIGFGHMRFISVMQLNHRAIFSAAVEAEGDDSFQRCIDHIAAALPDVPRAALNRKLVFFYQFAQASLSAREAAFVLNEDGGRLWGDPTALESLIDSLTASIVGAPPR
ncbi:TetR family transcriptional regulator [Stappia stellulata]|uniref:TetR/AcrR family transcriptional regulator n=1 Tax=Stappia stellulata TaxID=71235 RepID=UPI001CD2709C|nr:TetR/AcrR family transcriptional regulator [Stappia stellulata]MCA1243311.1 TetR family transcriptional regulator [Stappia stellulata]|eukprot:jgi/Tetstr1/445338/TSEL_033136.t1